MARGGRTDPKNSRFGSLLISSPQGHSGKTTVTLGLCYAFKRRGLSIQPFKKGPDYIDSSWLSVATGRICRNLDLFLISKKRLIQTFYEASRRVDLAIVEGAMGLYDGLDSHGTTAEIARLFGIPILLVVNTSRMTTSIAAMVSGYQRFQKDIRISGVILNYVSGKRHEKKLREAVEQYCGIPVVGSLPRDPDLQILERHLGLIPTLESREPGSLIEGIGARLEPCFDLDGILKIARSCRSPIPLPVSGTPCQARGRLRQALISPLRGRVGTGETKEDVMLNSVQHLMKSKTSETLKQVQGDNKELRHNLEGEERNPYPPIQGEGKGGVSLKGSPNVRIGVLRDRAFNFYYPENLEALSREGAELLFIDSLRDRLPKVDGLYIGGGFPEFSLKELEANRGLRKDIASAVERGLPAYAECGGLMYFCRGIRWQGKSYEMVGTLPTWVELSERPQGHGYVKATVVEKNPWFSAGQTLRGHEFHHSNLLEPKGLSFAYRIKKGEGIKGKRDGVFYKNLLASYVHLHTSGTPEWARSFVSLALRWTERRK